MEFRLLGPVELAVAGTPVKIGRRGERHLLAVLLLHLGRPVTADRLIAELWGERPPAAPLDTIHVYVSRLRGRLAAAGSPSGAQLIRHNNGYTIECSADQVDAHRFTRLLDEGQRALREGSVELARTTLAEALGLWRGAALADVPASPLVRAAAARLDEQRMIAVETTVDAELADGRHAEVLAELRALIGQYPLREQLHGRLMLALYRCGRQAEALAAYREVKQRLADELGVDPGPELRDLELAILRQDAGLAPAGGQLPRTPLPLAQLPADMVTFSGRETDLAELMDAVTGARDSPQETVRVVTIDGMAGVGKTALAVHAAHRLTPRFPDGQLFVDLHGHTPDLDPLDPADALDQLLRSLGVAGDDMPNQLDARAALYRAMLASKRLLLLLDNAYDEAQVRPLLPAAPDTLVLVTSRRRLTGLDDTHPVSLDSLPLADAVAMFTNATGAGRLRDEPAELITDVVELCGRLPLAIRIAAARLRHRRSWPLAYLVERLRAGHDSLRELTTGQRSVPSAIDLSYQDLPAARQRMFRLLGLHPGRDFDPYAAAALAGSTVEDAETMLDELLDAHLLMQQQPGRYLFHDLVRARAAHNCAGQEPEPDRSAALGRLADYYLHTAALATSQSHPIEPHLRPPAIPAAPSPVPRLNGDTSEPWLLAELPNLLAIAAFATQSDRLDHVPEMARVLERYLRVTGRTVDVEPLYRNALSIARARGDQVLQVDVLNMLGYLARRQGDYERAGERFRAARGHARECGHHPGHLYALGNLGDLIREQGDLELAQRYHQQTLELARQLGNAAYVTGALNGLAETHLAKGRAQQAYDYSLQALELAQQIDRPFSASNAMRGLGDAALRLGRVKQAVSWYEQANGIGCEIGDLNLQFEACNGLGRAHLAAGDPRRALDHLRLALSLAERLGQRQDQARAHSGLVDAQLALDEPALAGAHGKRALDLLTELGVSEIYQTSADEIRAKLAGPQPS